MLLAVLPYNIIWRVSQDRSVAVGPWQASPKQGAFRVLGALCRAHHHTSFLTSWAHVHDVHTMP